MSIFDKIRPFYDDEVQHTLTTWKHYPMMKALLHFTFPELTEEEREAILLSCNSIEDFQTKITYHSVKNVIEKSSEGFTTSGFEKLKPNTSYVFLSNHRDIILDTSLLNIALYNKGLTMTASAIGDNLLHKPFLMVLSRLNRNFLIQRGLGPREMLLSSKLVSEYIQNLIMKKKRSIWIAQREGRTKDGNDRTQQGVLKMLALANRKRPMDYLKSLRIVPVSISYELDPTDVLKMPELMAKHNNTIYTKANNEDFYTIIKGLVGQKKRIHIAIGNVLDNELDTISTKEVPNQQFQMLADTIDREIHKNYQLWPYNYIAYDILHKTQQFKMQYSEKEERQFQRRLEKRVEEDSEAARTNFLAMYANPVINKLNANG